MAKTFGTGADPKGLVNRGVEGSGAAQIFRPSQAVQDFVTGQRQQGLQKQKQKQAEAKAKEEKLKLQRQEFDKLKEVELSSFSLNDQKNILVEYGDFLNMAAQKQANGIDINRDPEVLAGKQALLLKSEAFKFQKQNYDKAMTALYNLSKDPNANKEQVAEYAIAVQNYYDAPMEERDDLSIVPTKTEKPIDLFKELKNLDIGYFTQADIDAETGLGERSKTVVKDKLKSQSESLVNAKPKVYEYGINQGLWTNKKEAADWFYLNKLYQADTSKEDIIRTTSKSNVFGTGSSSKEIEEDFNKWKQDFKSGDENAASFLFNVQLPSGARLDSFKAVPTVEQEQGYAAKGFAPRIKYMFKAAKMVGDAKITEDLEIEPLIEDDTQLYKFYISAVKDKNRTYGKDVAERTSKTKVIQDKPKAETNTPKAPQKKITFPEWKAKNPNGTYTDYKKQNP